jgi:hypothetical protein
LLFDLQVVAVGGMAAPLPFFIPVNFSLLLFATPHDIMG